MTEAPPFRRLTVEFAQLYGKACREARQMAEGSDGGVVGLCRRWSGGAPGGWIRGMRRLGDGIFGAGDAYQTQYFSSNTNKRMRF
jgi:hypothetical protein